MRLRACIACLLLPAGGCAQIPDHIRIEVDGGAIEFTKDWAPPPPPDANATPPPEADATPPPPEPETTAPDDPATGAGDGERG